MKKTADHREARWLAHKRRVDEQRKRDAIARRDVSNVAALHRVAKAKP